MRTYKIGRAETNDFVIADSTVSRNHAELTDLGNGRFRLKDLGSTFGTQVMQGGQWVKIAGETEIGRDARIMFGEAEKSLSDMIPDPERTQVRPPGAPAPVAPPPVPRPAAAPPPPKPAAPKPAAAPAPRKEIPRAAPPAPRAAIPAASPGAGSQVNKKTWMYLAIGGGVLALMIVIAIVAVLIGGGDSQPSANRGAGQPTMPGGPLTPPGPGAPSQPSTPAPAGAKGKIVAACTKAGGNATQCGCAADAILQGATAEEANIWADFFEKIFAQDVVGAQQVLQRLPAQQAAAMAQKVQQMTQRMQNCMR